MSKYYLKIPIDFLAGKVWPRGRKYSKVEALVYLLNNPEDSICRLAKVYDWSKSTTKIFVDEMVDLGYIQRGIEHPIEQKSNKNRTLTEFNSNELQPSAEQKSNKNRTLNRTHLNKDNNTPLILSSTKVESNIYPPKGNLSYETNNDFLKFQEWLIENAPRVAKMKEPFSAAQFAALKKDFDTMFICDLLKDMDNYQPLLTKNRSAYRTFLNWAVRKKRWDNENKPTNSRRAGDASPDELLRAVAEGISRANTGQEWQGRAVNL